jgi:hypothetical protein
MVKILLHSVTRIAGLESWKSRIGSRVENAVWTNSLVHEIPFINPKYNPTILCICSLMPLGHLALVLYKQGSRGAAWVGPEAQVS